MKTGPVPKADCQRAAKEPSIKLVEAHLEQAKGIVKVPAVTPTAVKPTQARIGRARKSIFGVRYSLRVDSKMAVSMENLRRVMC